MLFFTSPFAASSHLLEDSTKIRLDPTPIIASFSGRYLTAYEYVYERSKLRNALSFDQLLERAQQENLFCEFTEINILMAYAARGYAEGAHYEFVDKLLPEGIPNNILSEAAYGFAKRGPSERIRVQDLLKRGARVTDVLRGYAASQYDCSADILALYTLPSQQNALIMGYAEHGNRDIKILELFRKNSTLLSTIVYAYARYGKLKLANSWANQSNPASRLSHHIAQGLAEGGYDTLLDEFVRSHKDKLPLFEHATYGYEKAGRIRSSEYMGKAFQNHLLFSSSGYTSSASGHVILAKRILACNPLLMLHIAKGFAYASNHAEVECQLIQDISYLEPVVSEYQRTDQLTDDAKKVKVLAHFTDEKVRLALVDAFCEGAAQTEQAKTSLLERSSLLSELMQTYGFSYNQALAMQDVNAPLGFIYLLNNCKLTSTHEVAVLTNLGYNRFGIKLRGGLRDFLDKIDFHNNIKCPLIRDLDALISSNSNENPQYVKKVKSLIKRCMATSSTEALVDLLTKKFAKEEALKEKNMLTANINSTFRQFLQKLGIEVEPNRVIALSTKQANAQAAKQTHHENNLFQL